MSTVNRMRRRQPRRRDKNQLINKPKYNPEEHQNLGVYKCKHCTYYHVGHDNRPVIAPVKTMAQAV
jgi:hypothetical protein